MLVTRLSEQMLVRSPKCSFGVIYVIQIKFRTPAVDVQIDVDCDHGRPLPSLDKAMLMLEAQTQNAYVQVDKEQ